jgi:hypothetical protein
MHAEDEMAPVPVSYVPATHSWQPEEDWRPRAVE